MIGICLWLRQGGFQSAELTGRYYGGGVLELTPQEFKKLPVPYVESKDFDFTEYATSFQGKTAITDILRDNDQIILGEALGLDTDAIEQVSAIYRKLINKRFRNNQAALDIEPVLVQEANFWWKFPVCEYSKLKELNGIAIIPQAL